MQVFHLQNQCGVVMVLFASLTRMNLISRSYHLSLAIMVFHGTVEKTSKVVFLLQVQDLSTGQVMTMMLIFSMARVFSKVLEMDILDGILPNLMQTTLLFRVHYFR